MNIQASPVTCPRCSEVIPIPQHAIRANLYKEPDKFCTSYMCKCGLSFPRGNGRTEFDAIADAYNKAISCSLQPLTQEQLGHLPPRMPVVCFNHENGTHTFCSAFSASLDLKSKEYAYFRTIPMPEYRDALVAEWRGTEKDA